jgi:hypothetical protein
MTSERTVGIPPLRTRLRLQAPMWFAFFGGATFWGFRLGLSYLFVPYACRTGAMWVLHTIFITTTLLSLLAAFVGYRVWQDAKGTREQEGRWDDLERTEFMGIAGMAMSAFFALVIILESTPNFFVDPCLGAGFLVGE